jgi:hypothetical protein
MTKEALKLALEALETLMIERGSIYDQAITAIKEALAQPEQEQCCYGGIAHDCHAGESCRIVKRMQAAQRTWVGLTDEDFLEACQIAERGNYLVAFQRIQAKLKEKNT